ncbi:MAG TPA: phosphate-starvation-inducible PsiE family protein [Rubrobacteraceae bacterium]|nr:phosphate-starvation-inducible PsiE family protein [Rubrobacteraceae bacterium]
MARQPNKVNLLSVLDAAERLIYYVVALALIIPIIMLFVSAAASMLRVLEVGVLQTVLVVLDRALLVFIFVELLDTIRITVRERGSIVAEPFLLVGLIAVVRRILLVTAQIEQVEDTEAFQNLLTELVVMAGLVIVLTIALYFTRRMRRLEQESESS